MKAESSDTDTDLYKLNADDDDDSDDDDASFQVSKVKEDGDRFINRARREISKLWK